MQNPPGLVRRFPRVINGLYLVANFMLPTIPLCNNSERSFDGIFVA